MKLTTRQLSVRRGRRLVVEDATLELDCGVHGLLGVNGSGKTSLLRCLATAIRSSGGEYAIDNLPVRANLNRARVMIGYAPQRPIAIRNLTCAEQIEYAAWLKRYPLSMTGAAVHAAIEDVGLGDYRDSKVGSLSGGTLKRLGVAMAIVTRPLVLLLDEPTAGVDSSQRHRFYQLAEELKNEHVVLMSSHLVEDFTAVCEDVIVLDGGRTARRGSPEEIAAQ